MTTRIDLSIASTYVQDWTYVEAIRELFQNSIDAQEEDSLNTTGHHYVAEDNELHITSKLSVLERRTLLLGATSKADNENTIGKFGEGYKIALMVLLREDMAVTIINYGAKEVWFPSMEYSEVFDADVLSIKICDWDDKYYPTDKKPHDLLQFHVKGVTPERMGTLVRANLNLSIHDSIAWTDQGKVLLGEDQARRVYVNGLFVEESKTKLRYGYDFKPMWLDLDRDRRAVSSFELVWATSRMWAQSEDLELVYEMLQDDVPDVSKVPATITTPHLSDYALKCFKNKYGDNAIPVTSQEEYDEILKFGYYKPVFCPEALTRMITGSLSYEKAIAKRKSTLSPHQLLQAALTDSNGNVHKNVDIQIPRLLKLSENWRWNKQ